MIYEELLKKQGYMVWGNTAVKLCSWTKKSLRNEGVCYKQKFYGIQSHRCLQMTPTVNVCNHNCLFCWRAMDYVRGKSKFEEPKEIVEKTIEFQKKLLVGFKGDKRVDLKKWEEAQNPNQVAISLLGEPTLYPYLDELIKEYEKRGFTTFVVSNGTMPNVIEKINPTQLYITLAAPDKETYTKLCRPLIKDGWERIKESFGIMKEKKCRKVARLTMVKGWNMKNPEEYIKIIDNSVDFIEAKAYMYVSYSRERMKVENMPYHEEVKEFSKEIEKISDYNIIDEKKESRVVLLSNGKKPRFIKKL